MPIRQPTPAAEIYRWWRAALADPRHPRHESEPQSGWFKMRMVKDGPWIPCRIWVEREVDPATGELMAPEVLRCEVGGERRNPERVWTSVRAITREAYDALVRLQAENSAMSATMVPYDTSKEPMRP